VSDLCSFKAKTKEDAGRELARVESEISRVVVSLDPLEFVPILLCLEDAINNLEITIIRSRRIEGNLYEDRYFAASQFITEWYVMINDAITAILDNNHFSSKKEIAKLPELSFGIYFDKNLDEQLLLLCKKGELDPNDFIYRKPRIFLNKIPGWFYIAVHGKINRSFKERLEVLFNLRDLLFRRGLLETMLYVSPEGTEVEFDDTGLRKISLPTGVTAESVFEQQGMTPRLLETYASVFDWNSFFREIADENLKHAEMGRNEANIERLRKEDEEIFQAYDSIKSYSETFNEFYGVSFKTFFDFLSAVTYLCFPRRHTLRYWKFSDFLQETKLKTFSTEEIKIVVDLLSESKVKKRYSGFVRFDDLIMTSFRRLTASRLILMEKCYSEALNNDLKGKAFEDACRKMLQSNDFKTINGRVDIPEPTMPYEASFALLGKQKQKTDLDVISSQNNAILVIECKEIKSEKLKLRDEKQFKKYLVEHFFKIKWILDNFQKFENYAGGTLNDLLSVDTNKPVYLFPLLVTNILVNIEGIKETPLITYLELKEMISMKGLFTKTDGTASGAIEVEIKNHRISLPWISFIRKTEAN